MVEFNAKFNSNNVSNMLKEIKKELKKSQLSVEVVEGLFECPKCKGKETESYSVQLRRADEPPTVFIECINKRCKHKWRMG